MLTIQEVESLARTFPADQIANALQLRGPAAVGAAHRLDQLFSTLEALARSSGGVEPYLWAMVVTHLQEAVAAGR